ncbi:MAG: ubiquinol-cytochrome c reductase iron-sulfur subunit [Gammaproteobacteria bacterium]|nr:MAG: ubiquinol-cytochrome c reductase iron-sulfur subunit [Gammaproteobacteria bacterium]
MSQDNIDHRRRRILTAAATVVGGAGVVAALVPFVSYMEPSAKARAAGAPVDVDISKLEPGQLIVVEWRGKPIWILQRTKEQLDKLPELNDKLRDPFSEESKQPASCKNIYRSIKPEYFVAVGICTHLGCSPTFRPEVAPPDLGPDWVGGFFCPCHGSRFDLAGRVFKGVPAPLNLEVPPYRFVSEHKIVVGIEQGAA